MTQNMRMRWECGSCHPQMTQMSQMNAKLAGSFARLFSADDADETDEDRFYLRTICVICG